VRFVLASHATVWICSPSMQPALETQVIEPAFPPQDATPSIVRTVVLIV
jgi:hypothetical protein